MAMGKNAQRKGSTNRNRNSQQAWDNAIQFGLESLESRKLMSFSVTPTIETDPVPHSGDAADDAAIWVHPTDVSKSTIIGSDKDGGLAVYDLSGNELQYVSIGEVNNVDLRHGFTLGGVKVDIVVGSNRSNNVLAIYKVNPTTRLLEEVAARDLVSNMGEMYGLALYHSPFSGKFYAFTSDRDDGRVEQWELYDNGAGLVDGKIVRTFDAGGTVEGMVADDETGALYAGEETGGLWKYGAEPTAGTSRVMLDTTDSGGRLTADLEGLAIYYADDGKGYLLASNQGANEFMIYDRVTGAFIDKFTVVSGAIDGVNDTDGIDVTSFGLGPMFPAGVFVVQDGSNNDGNQNFKLVDWRTIVSKSTTPLMTDNTQDPRGGTGTTPTPTPEPTPSAPSAPSALSASAASSTRVDLTWTDNSSVETGFRIERRTGSSTTWTQIGTTGANATTYADTTASASTSYSYRVVAYNSAGSNASNTASVTTPAAPAPTEPTPVTGSTLVAKNSTWSYLDNGSNQGTAWTSLSFDDSAWKTGSGELGYGDGDEATVVSKGGSTTAITTYFRKSISITDPATFTSLTLSLLRDDGAVVYLNGVEIARSNMPTGTISYTTGASSTVGGSDEDRYYTFSVDPALLRAGTNVIAVEIHQANTGSTDISFDLALEGVRSSGTTDPTVGVPAAPTGLSATASTGRIDLAWTDNSSVEANYRVERSSDGSNWAGVANLGANVTTYADTTVTAGATYYYRVFATNSAGTSGASNTANATVPGTSTEPTPTPDPDPTTTPGTFIDTGSTWRYLDNGSNQGTTWRSLSFDDSAWKSGAAQLGYGDGDEATVVSTGGSTKAITTYFRKSFDVTDPSAVTDLVLKLMRDDGAVVYLNGVEIARSNMPTGTISYTTRASSTIGGSDESRYYTFNIDPALLRAGTNVIAVEIHQSNAGSTDVSFDLSLTGQIGAPTSGGDTGGEEPTVGIPAAPTSLLATAVSTSRIDLSWADNSSVETSYVIERSLDGVGWSQLASVGANVTSYSNTGLPAGTKYYYRVKAVNSAGSSSYTATASATTQVEATPTPPPGSDDVVYSSPIVITKGGTYTGNWQSLDPNVAAVTIKTTEAVTIVNSNIRSKGNLIETDVDGANVTIRNTRGYGLNPNVYGEVTGRFFDGYRVANVLIENNYLEGTAGIKVLEYAGNYSSSNTVRILNNVALNIDGRKSDGNGGYLDFNERTRLSDGVEEDGYKIRQFVQLDKVNNLAGIVIAWNQVTNEPGKSRVEDNINIYKSSGTSASPILIHDNYVKGAYTIKPWLGGTTSDGTYSYDWGYAGGGILLGDGSSGVAYVRAYNNTVVGTTNYGIAIAAGHDMAFYNNRIIASGLLPDGRKIAEQNVGAYIWDLYGTGSSFYNNTGSNNLIGWMDNDGDRNDWWLPDASSWTGNTSYSGSLTLATEANEYTLWQQKAAAAGQTVGVK